METETITAMAAIVGYLATAVVWVNKEFIKKKLKKKEKENDVLKNNIYQTKLQKVKELYDLQHFSSIERLIHKLFNKTPIDRFTVMFVMNGTTDFNYLTVLYDESTENREIGDISPYTRFKIDGKYLKMLHQMELDGMVWRKYPDFNIGNLDEYLTLEKIKDIGWAFVYRIKLDEYNDLLVFASISSEVGGLSDMDKKLLELTFNGRIRPHLEKILLIPDLEDESILEEIFPKEQEL